jgi:hypothetical protein
MADDAHALFRRRLEQRYDFAAWAARLPLGRSLRFAADPHALPEVRLEQRKPLPGLRGHIDQLVSERVPGGRIAATVVEHADAAAAHEALLGLLGNAMRQLPSCEERGLAIGDVCFCSSGEPVARVWFTRANVLVQVESVGERLLAATAVAAALDAQIAATVRP